MGRCCSRQNTVRNKSLPRWHKCDTWVYMFFFISGYYPFFTWTQPKSEASLIFIVDELFCDLQVYVNEYDDCCQITIISVKFQKYCTIPFFANYALLTQSTINSLRNSLNMPPSSFVLRTPSSKRCCESNMAIFDVVLF